MRYCDECHGTGCNLCLDRGYLPELRLHFDFANQPEQAEQKKNPPDIEEALATWRELNKNPNIWARFDSMQFEHERVTNVHWGYIHSGQKKCMIQTISYRYLNNGRMYSTTYTHP